MENQPKLNSSKEVIAFLAERFPHCFSAEGEARPLKIGIFQDLVDRVAGEMNLSKTQLRSALRLYTSSWRYLYGVKPGATRVDLDGNPCGELDEQHVEHARKQLEEAKARVQAQRANELAAQLDTALTTQLTTGSTDGHLAWLVPLLKEYYDPMYRYQHCQLSLKLRRNKASNLAVRCLLQWYPRRLRSPHRQSQRQWFTCLP